MEPLKRNTGPHETQKPHSAEECRINESPHNHPDTDCGHHVKSGPGATSAPDLNTYDDDYGKRCIVAGAPDHNLDQDVAGGPGASD